ncbi:thioesterase II family protein [Paenibacillus solani]|uniref:thioesterase II family protein n=1 Tax=Paenibacillus solani TaxID=1705565 RepID=UPI003D276110
MICLPYAGGNASIYHEWAELFPKELEVLAIQLPGRGSRFVEDRYTEVDRLIPALLNELVPFTDKPLMLFGHSMGALLCYELAHQLMKLETGALQHLFVSAYRAPQLASDRKELRHDLPAHELKQFFRKLNGIPAEIMNNDDMMNFILPILRADVQLCDTYTYQERPPLPCGITAFGGSADPEVNLHQLQAWKELTASEFNLHMLPGDHFFIHSQQELLVGLLMRRMGELFPDCIGRHSYDI